MATLTEIGWTFSNVGATSKTVTLTDGAAVGDVVFVVVTYSADSGTIPTLTSCVDSKSNSYSLVGDTGTGSGTAQGHIIKTTVANALVAGDTITVTINTSRVRWAGPVAYKTEGVGNLDKSAETNNGAFVTYITTGDTGTLSNPNQLAVAYFGFGTGRTITPDPGWTPMTMRGSSAGSNDRVVQMMYQTVGDVASLNAGLTLSSNGTYASWLGTFPLPSGSVPDPDLFADDFETGSLINWPTQTGSVSAVNSGGSPSAPTIHTGVGNVTQATSSSASGLTADKPANLVDGDLLWAIFHHRNAAAVLTAPVGWAWAKQESGNGTFGIAFKVVATDSAEPSTYSFTTDGGSNRCTLDIGRISGADPATVVNIAGASSVFTGTTSLVHPGVTTTRNNCLLLAVSTNNTTTGTAALFTPAGGMSEVTENTINTGAATSTTELAAETFATAGATGTRTATISPAAANSAGFLVAVNAKPVGDYVARLNPAATAASLATSTVKWSQSFYRWGLFRCNFRLNSVPAGTSADLFTIQNTAQVDNLDFFYSNTTGTFQFDLRGGVSTVNTGLTPVLGRWYDLTMLVDYGSTTHSAQVWIDGQKYGGTLTQSGATAGHVRSLHVGTTATTKTYQLDVDNVSMLVGTSQPSVLRQSWGSLALK